MNIVVRVELITCRGEARNAEVGRTSPTSSFSSKRWSIRPRHRSASLESSRALRTPLAKTIGEAVDTRRWEGRRAKSRLVNGAGTAAVSNRSVCTSDRIRRVGGASDGHGRPTYAVQPDGRAGRQDRPRRARRDDVWLLARPPYTPHGLALDVAAAAWRQRAGDEDAVFDREEVVDANAVEPMVTSGNIIATLNRAERQGLYSALTKLSGQAPIDVGRGESEG
jgi:hypothetical protein